MLTNGDRISTDGDGKLELDTFGRAESNGGGGDLSCVVMAPDRAPKAVNPSMTDQRQIGSPRWLNHGELKRRFCGFLRLQSGAFRTLFGDKIGMEMTGIARSSDRYQPWPVKWPEMEIASGSGCGPIPVSSNGRSLSTGSNRVDDPLKSEGTETPNVKPPSNEKVLVLGGNGFVGSHICKEALERGLTVSSFSRSGRSSLKDSWAESVVWHQGDLLSPDSLKDSLIGVNSVISCVGGFGSNSYMYKINGTANINAVKAAKEQGVKRFVFVSAADFGLVNYLLRGYYEGKRATEKELMTELPHGGVILRPGFIHGTRQVGSIKLPLSVIGAPLEMMLKHAKVLTAIPLVGPLLIPPVRVTSVAKVAVSAATDPTFPHGIIDVYSILQHSQQKSA
ncbi:NAD(P)-bd dom domain-containing protein [Citrus sinensis]|nr:NAD(P)-bd dom domain-containing protein [Citrus sinensis]